MQPNLGIAIEFCHEFTMLGAKTDELPNTPEVYFDNGPDCNSLIAVLQDGGAVVEHRRGIGKTFMSKRFVVVKEQA